MLLTLATLLGTTIRAADQPRTRSTRRDETGNSPLDRLKKRSAESRWRNRVGQWSVPSPEFGQQKSLLESRNSTSPSSPLDQLDRLNQFGNWNDTNASKAVATPEVAPIANEPNDPSSITAKTSEGRLTSRLEASRLQRQIMTPRSERAHSLFEQEPAPPAPARPMSLFDEASPSSLVDTILETSRQHVVPEPNPEPARSILEPIREPVREFRPFQSDVPRSLRTPIIEPDDDRTESVTPSTDTDSNEGHSIPSATGLFGKFDSDPFDVSADGTFPASIELTEEVATDRPTLLAAPGLEIDPNLPSTVSEQAVAAEPKPLSTPQTVASAMNNKVFVPVPLTVIRPDHDYSPANRPIGKPGEAGGPKFAAMPNIGTLQRDFIPLDFMWEPSNLFHNPLYFEDPELERYGHTSGQFFQPIASITRFGVQLAGLPYQIAIEPMGREVSVLGQHRPGEAIPARLNQIPWNPEAALGAGLFYTGLSFVP